MKTPIITAAALMALLLTPAKGNAQAVEAELAYQMALVNPGSIPNDQFSRGELLAMETSIDYLEIYGETTQTLVILEEYWANFANQAKVNPNNQFDQGIVEGFDLAVNDLNRFLLEPPVIISLQLARPGPVERTKPTGIQN